MPAKMQGIYWPWGSCKLKTHLRSDLVFAFPEALPRRDDAGLSSRRL